MTAKYYFEEELLKTYDFEPWQDCYKIDDLKEGERRELSGMLYGFYCTLNFFENEKENEFGGIAGQLKQEHLDDVKNKFEAAFLAEIEGFILGTLDSYEE